MKKVTEFIGGKDAYSALLRSAEWQSFARVIRKERGNACECCRQSNKELHVHHFFYDPKKKPWEADKRDVVVLCKNCHRELHEQLHNFRRFVFRSMRPEHLRVLNGALAVGLTKHDPLKFVYAIAELAASPGSVERFAAAWKPESAAAGMPLTKPNQ